MRKRRLERNCMCSVILFDVTSVVWCGVAKGEREREKERERERERRKEYDK